MGRFGPRYPPNGLMRLEAVLGNGVVYGKGDTRERMLPCEKATEANEFREDMLFKPTVAKQNEVVSQVQGCRYSWTIKLKRIGYFCVHICVNRSVCPWMCMQTILFFF